MFEQERAAISNNLIRMDRNMHERMYNTLFDTLEKVSASFLKLAEDCDSLEARIIALQKVVQPAGGTDGNQANESNDTGNPNAVSGKPGR